MKGLKRDIRICVVGGKKGIDNSIIKTVLDDLHYNHKVCYLMYGSAVFNLKTSAEYQSSMWGFAHGVKQLVFKPDFKLFGGQATKFRILEIFEIGMPDLILNFDPPLPVPDPTIMSTVDHIMSMARDRGVTIKEAQTQLLASLSV